MPSSRVSSQPRDRTVPCGSCIAGRFLTTEPPGKPLIAKIPQQIYLYRLNGWGVGGVAGGECVDLK